MDVTRLPSYGIKVPTGLVRIEGQDTAVYITGEHAASFGAGLAQMAESGIYNDHPRTKHFINTLATLLLAVDQEPT